MAGNNKKMGLAPKNKQSSTRDRFYHKRLLGQLAVKDRKITPEQLDVVLKEQVRLWESNKSEKKIGQLFIEYGYLSETGVNELLKKQQVMDRVRKRTFDAKGKQSKDKGAASLVAKYHAGEVVFSEGDSSSRDLFVIQSGEISVYRDSVHIGKRVEQGSFLGTTSCLLKTPRVSTAVAVTETTLLRIPEDGVQRFFAKNPQMAIKLSSVLAQRLLQLTQKYVDVLKSVPQADESLRKSLLLEAAGNDSGRIARKDEAKFESSMVEQVSTKNDSILEYSESKYSGVLNSGGEEDAAVVSDGGEKAAALDGNEGAHGEASRSDVDFAADNTDNFDTFSVAGASINEGFTGEKDSEEECHGTDSMEEDAVESVKDKLDEGSQAAGDTENDDELPIEVDPIAEVMCEPDKSIVLPAGELKSIIEQEKPIMFAPEVREQLEKRLEMYLKLEDIAQKRNELEEKPNTTDRAKNELASLRRELNKIPPYESLKMKCEKLASMIAPEDPDASADVPKKPLFSNDVIRAYEISVEQKSLLLNWYDGMDELIAVCARSAADQFMFKMMQRVGVNPTAVFGWAVYVMAMNEYLEELREEQKNYREKLKKLKSYGDSNSNSGIFKMFKKKPVITEKELAAKEKELAETESLDLNCRLKINGITKELEQVEVVMVDAFWAVYGALGLKLVAGVDKDLEVYVRGYLRWGVLGLASDFIDPELLELLLAECQKGAQLPEYTMDANYILYADEIIELTAKKKLLPSPNEELELNERNSPRWKADRAHRKIVGGEFYLGILKCLQMQLEGEAKEKRNKQTAKEKEMASVPADDPDKKKKTSMLKKSVQALKVAAVKAEKLVEKVRDDMIPKLQEDVDSGNESLEELGLEIVPEELARHEIICIRRFSRLIAKLKEPFLPFTLRDRFNPELKTTNTKADVLAGLQDLEIKDPLIFKENMLATMKKNNRVQIRTCPFIHLMPASGTMGFLVAPRTDTYSGKLLLPAYFERTGTREEVFIDTFSDFRYDTSKEQAGMDVMNSDTLVAAYAEVRWLLRKKDKEVRQKAGVFTEENERTNWRRHYAMYIDSAFDGGKQLFFKCPDLYELIINKFIELPPDIEVLKRG